MFFPKNHPSVLRFPKHFVFALATLTGGCYSACYRGRYFSVTWHFIVYLIIRQGIVVLSVTLK